MFTEVELEGFRGVKSCEKPLNLSKFTLLIGANNAGKSAILEALLFIPTPHDPSKIPIIDKRRLDFISWIHGSGNSLVYRYGGHGNAKCALGRLHFNLQVGVDRGPDLKAEIVDEKRKLGSSEEIAKEMLGVSGSSEEAYRQLSSYTAFIPRNDEFLKSLDLGLYENWHIVEKTGAHVKVVRNIIAKVVEDRFTEVNLRKNEIVVRKEFTDGDVAYIRLADMGDGVKRFLPSALYLEALNPKVVLWDDLEASAHPSMIRAIIRWLAEHDWQVIASTHSIDLIREFVLEGPEDGKILSLRKSPDDILSHKELSIDDVEQFLESGQDVRKIMEWR